MRYECVLLDAAPLIPLIVTASEFLLIFKDYPRVETTQSQLSPSNALIKNNIRLPSNRAKN
jgi:hypothetical protein